MFLMRNPQEIAQERHQRVEYLHTIPGVYTAFNTVCHLAVHGRPLSAFADEVRCFDQDEVCSSNGGTLSGIVMPEVKFNWKDITADFMKCTDDLKLGELLHDANFGLFEAMSAIEMMDPKMDAGMVSHKTGHRVLNFKQSIAAGTLKIVDLELPELIGIIDTTLACIATWLEGHSLAQTVFTNLYTHSPDRIEDRCLKAFTLAVLKMVDVIKDKVIRAGVFEEEDFQSLTYGFKLAHNVTELRVAGMLKEVEEEYNRRIKTTRARQGEERDAAKEQEHELCIAVQSRIKFCRFFYMALLASNKKEVKQGVEETRKLLVQAADLLPAISKSIPLGIQPITNESNYPVIMGFEPLVNQRLLPPTFPRYSKILERESAIEYFDGLVTRLKAVCEVTMLSSFHVVLDFFSDFSKQCPCVLSRSVLQLIFLPFNNKKAFGVEMLPDVLKDCIRLFVCPPALAAKSPLYNNAQAKETVDALMLHSVRPMCTLVQIQGHNHARQRDKLGQALEELANLQEEVRDAAKGQIKLEALLGQILKKYLSVILSSVMALTSAQAKKLVSRVIGQLRYLADFLYAWFISTVTRADSMLQEHEVLYVDLPPKGRSNKKKNKRKKTRPLERELMQAQGLQTLCSAYYKTVVGFTLDGKLKRPNCEFDNEKVRFEHRFGNFASVLTPPLVQYEQFCDITDMRKFEQTPTVLDMYYAASKLFMQSSSMLEKISNPSSEISSLVRVAKTNMVVLKLLMGGHKRDSHHPPEFEFTTNKTFPIIKLK